MALHRATHLASGGTSSTRVVYDLELGRGFGYGLAELGIAGFALAVTWSERDGFIHWDGRHGRALLQFLLDFDEIVGFNLLSYDNSVLRGYLLASEHTLVRTLQDRTIDLHHRLYVASGRRYSLQDVATSTLGEGKRPAPRGDDPLLLAEYCERDVELTHDLDDFRRTYGLLYVRGLTSYAL